MNCDLYHFAWLVSRRVEPVRLIMRYLVKLMYLYSNLLHCHKILVIRLYISNQLCMFQMFILVYIIGIEKKWIVKPEVYHPYYACDWIRKKPQFWLRLHMRGGACLGFQDSTTPETLTIRIDLIVIKIIRWSLAY